MNTEFVRIVADIERRNGGWISVKDKLPEDDPPKNSTRLNIKVLTTVSKNGRNSIRTLCRERWIKGFNPTVYYDWIWAKDARNITHWMPLPQPPEQEQSNPDNTTTVSNPYWQRVCAIADKQRAKGIAEYGQGLEDNPADIAQRITYLEEEMVDGLMYCEWIKARLDGERPESADR